MPCFYCNETGSCTPGCPKPSSDGGGDYGGGRGGGRDVSRYNRGGSGQRSRESSQPREGRSHGGGGRGDGGGGGDSVYLNCQQPGHMSRECPMPRPDVSSTGRGGGIDLMATNLSAQRQMLDVRTNNVFFAIQRRNQRLSEMYFDSNEAMRTSVHELLMDAQQYRDHTAAIEEHLRAELQDEQQAHRDTKANLRGAEAELRDALAALHGGHLRMLTRQLKAELVDARDEDRIKVLDSDLQHALQEIEELEALLAEATGRAAVPAEQAWDLRRTTVGLQEQLAAAESASQNDAWSDGNFLAQQVSAELHAEKNSHAATAAQLTHLNGDNVHLRAVEVQARLAKAADREQYLRADLQSERQAHGATLAAVAAEQQQASYLRRTMIGLQEQAGRRELELQNTDARSDFLVQQVRAKLEATEAWVAALEYHQQSAPEFEAELAEAKRREQRVHRSLQDLEKRFDDERKAHGATKTTLQNELRRAQSDVDAKKREVSGLQTTMNGANKFMTDLRKALLDAKSALENTNVSIPILKEKLKADAEADLREVTARILRDSVLSEWGSKIELHALRACHSTWPRHECPIPAARPDVVTTQSRASQTSAEFVSARALSVNGDDLAARADAAAGNVTPKRASLSQLRRASAATSSVFAAERTSFDSDAFAEQVATQRHRKQPSAEGNDATGAEAGARVQRVGDLTTHIALEAQQSTEVRGVATRKQAAALNSVEGGGVLNGGDRRRPRPASQSRDAVVPQTNVNNDEVTNIDPVAPAPLAASARSAKTKAASKKAAAKKAAAKKGRGAVKSR
jgi:hypothetical protein